MARRSNRGAGDRRGFGNWVIGGTSLSSVGAPSAGTSWGTSRTLAGGTPQSMILVSSADYSPSAATPVAAMVGELQVNAVEGSLALTNFANCADAGVVVAIYVTNQLSTASTSFTVRDPGNAADAQRDDYLFIRGFSTTASGTNLTAPTIVPVMINRPVVIASGQALVMTVSLTGAMASCIAVPWVRSHVRRAA